MVRKIELLGAICSILGIIFFLLFPNKNSFSDSSQQSYGPQSPNVIAGGNVKIEYHNVSTKTNQLTLKIDKEIELELNLLSEKIFSHKLSSEEQKIVNVLLPFLDELRKINEKYIDINTKYEKCILKSRTFASLYKRKDILNLLQQRCEKYFKNK